MSEISLFTASHILRFLNSGGRESSDSVEFHRFPVLAALKLAGNGDVQLKSVPLDLKTVNFVPAARISIDRRRFSPKIEIEYLIQVSSTQLTEPRMPQSPNFRENPLRSWLPSTSLSNLRQEVSDLVESVFGESISQLRGESSPRVDVAETVEAVEITTDLPGYSRQEIQVDLDEKSITISGTHTAEAAESDESKKYHRLERKFGNFSRTVWLPCPVDEASSTARLVNGILTVRLPKKLDPYRRKIEVQGPEQSFSVSPE